MNNMNSKRIAALLEAINVRWVTWWRNVPVMRLMGGIETAFGAAVLLRPHAGPAGAGADVMGISPVWFAAALLVCGLPALVLRLHLDWYFVLVWPLMVYALLAVNWAVTDAKQPLTAIAANFSVVALLLKLAATVAYGNHDHG